MPRPPAGPPPWPWADRVEFGWLDPALAAVVRPALDRRARELAEVAAGPGARRVWLEAVDPAAFLAGLAAAWTPAAVVFLANPRWSPAERTRALAQSDPHLLWREHAAAVLPARPRPYFIRDVPRPPDPALVPADGPLLAIPTGGTGGEVRFAVHRPSALAAAAAGLHAWAGGQPLSSLCLLPLFHVSGLMQVVRSLRTGGRLHFGSWAALEAGTEQPEPPPFLSLVPTQLARLLETAHGPGWLAQVGTIFVGGAALPAAVADAARRLHLRLAPAWGSTETAAQVAAQPPESFLAGERGVGPPLPHARITPGPAGTLVVRGASLFLGYWPLVPGTVPPKAWDSGDRGRVAADGSIEVLGREDDRINTGAEKVDPAEVEAAVTAAGLGPDALVCGVPDPDWGEVVGLLLVARVPPGPGLPEVRDRLRPLLAPHKLPRRLLLADRLPLTALGKPDRRAARARLQSAPDISQVSATQA